jgi:hypothetical protein
VGERQQRQLLVVEVEESYHSPTVPKSHSTRYESFRTYSLSLSMNHLIIRSCTV